jgi:hypothetical protein
MQVQQHRGYRPAATLLDTGKFRGGDHLELAKASGDRAGSRAGRRFGCRNHPSCVHV